MNFSPLLMVTFASLIWSLDAKFPNFSNSILCKMIPRLCPPQQISSIPSSSPSTSSSISTSPSTLPSTPPSTSSSTGPSTSTSTAPSTSTSISTSPSTSPLLTELPSESPSERSSDAPTPPPTWSARPNLIMILTDEHSFRTLGCYRDFMKSEDQANEGYIWGDGIEVETPNIDRLAKEGTLFSNFYTVAPLCTPSRASFMSGLYPQKTGESEDNHGRMDDDIMTFAKVLKSERKYLTSYFGKWHLNGEEKPGWSNNTRKFGFEDTTYQFNRGHWKFLDVVDGERQAYEFKKQTKFEGIEDKHFTTDFLFDRGIEFIESATSKGQPFASVLSIPDPHSPNEVRQPYENMYKHFKFTLPSTGTAAWRKSPAAPIWNYLPGSANVTLKEVDDHLDSYEVHIQDYMQQYFGMVKCIDDNVGKLLNYLKEKGIDEETIIVFTSDHGDLLGEHGKQNKGRPYKTSAGIPFLIRYPGTVPEGKVIKTAYSSVDFFPSILSLMNAKYDTSKVDGINFKSELLDTRNVTDGDNIRFTFDTGRSPNWVAAIQRQYKLVISGTDSPWLFDMKEDPDEITNFFDEESYAQQRDVMLDSLYKAMHEHDMPLKNNAKILFWSTPNCQDSRDRIYLSKGVAILCENLEYEPDKADLCKKERFKTLCPLSCGNCCRDTVEKHVWSKGQLKTCETLTEKDCRSYKARMFCPVTCNYSKCEDNSV